MRYPIDFGDRPWHRWFAWYPVRIGNERVWWEWVERNKTNCHGWIIPHYRHLDPARLTPPATKGTEYMNDEQENDALARVDKPGGPDQDRTALSVIDGVREISKIARARAEQRKGDGAWAAIAEARLICGELDALIGSASAGDGSEQMTETVEESTVHNNRTINFACGCFVMFIADGDQVRELLACCAVHERPDQTLKGILGEAHEIAIRERYIPRHVPTLDEQMAALRTVFPDATINDGPRAHYRTVRLTIELPEGVWNRSGRLWVEFDVADTFPWVRPSDGFWTDSSLRLANGALPSSVSQQSRGSDTALWYYGRILAWDPLTCSLLTVARIIRLVLHRDPQVVLS